jgi:hypothetical protein
MRGVCRRDPAAFDLRRVALCQQRALRPHIRLGLRPLRPPRPQLPREGGARGWARVGDSEEATHRLRSHAPVKVSRFPLPS